MKSHFASARGWTLLAACALLPAAVGCGDSDYSSITSGSVNVDQSNYCNQVARVICANVFACCTGAETEDKLGLTLTITEEKCVRDLQLVCANKYYRIMFGLANNTINVAADRATACLKGALWEKMCFPVMSQVPWKSACYGNESSLTANLFFGSLAAGQDCVYSEQCKKDHLCEQNGKCAALPTATMKCRTGGVCASAYYCNTTNNTCVARKGPGQICKQTVQCKVKHFCGGIDPATGNGTCRALLARGVSCRANLQCQSGKCIPGKCATTGATCYKPADCQRVCQGDTATTCTQNDQCPRKCAKSGNPCASDQECDVASLEQCLPGTCLPAACNGNPVCGDAWGVVNYCTGPLQLLLGL
jgi:hypothetical protein